ncbi:MAG: TIGR02444 family protein [Trebonia sp.]
MGEAASTGRFKRFALELYRRPGVADACLALQDRHDLDVNVVLFAAFAGAAQRRTLTAHDLMQAHRRVNAWHHEVVRPLRAVRQRLKTGPAPAPNDATGQLRRKLAQLEIEAEIVELDQLGAFIPETGPQCPTADAAACAAAAIQTVITTLTGAALTDEDREVIEAIAAAAQQVDAGR